ncbi:DUF1963 domain-containing protein [Pseudonocardia sp. TRM90224]|uniref:DUF1963 domain-containing protein n=1 Tax=Pseudonocardia sp. TRM90224 TaxID=2812678 RepID=UPI001E326B19|nr:DUF1963 domain-containing protein [Pseudonocardia sp. TRM90224]
MMTLLAYAGPSDPSALGARTGGVPLVPAGFDWPVCAHCHGNMQFIAQLPLDALDPSGDLVSIFMCANDPGLCDEWDPIAGGNRAFLLRKGELLPATVPAEGETDLGSSSRVELLPSDVTSYAEAYDTWTDSTGRDQNELLGCLGGEPAWIQDEEIPSCTGCAQQMEFIAQLEPGHDDRTAANYGDAGSAYAFACRPCGGASFLWQCH